MEFGVLLPGWFRKLIHKMKENIQDEGWKGSVYKLLWREVLMFLFAYYVISISYRYALNKQQRYYFEKLSEHCEKYTQIIPLTFVLGFYLNIVYERWWQQFQMVQWPDRLAMYLATFLHGTDDRGRMLRRTIIRHINLSAVLGLRMISSAVLKRFPTMEHLIEAGFLTENELKLYDSITTAHPRHWVPCCWAATLLRIAREENRIKNDRELLEMTKEVNDFYELIRHMTHYDWISVPLVYTQVVTLAVYSFCLACLMGRQWLRPEAGGVKPFDLYFPFFTVLQLVFYLGWLKVAEVAINPFGEDDDDFEVNFILERNLQVSYEFVDECYDTCPLLEFDLHWNKRHVEVPHTAASWGLKDAGFRGSTVDIKIPVEDTEIVIAPSTPVPEDEESGFFLDDEKQCSPQSLLQIAKRSSSQVINNSNSAAAGQHQGLGMVQALIRKRSRRGTIAGGQFLTRPLSACRPNSYLSRNNSVPSTPTSPGSQPRRVSRTDSHLKPTRRVPSVIVRKASTNSAKFCRSTNMEQEAVPSASSGPPLDVNVLNSEIGKLKRDKAKLQRQDRKLSGGSHSPGSEARLSFSSSSLETIAENGNSRPERPAKLEKTGSRVLTSPSTKRTLPSRGNSVTFKDSSSPEGHSS